MIERERECCLARLEACPSAFVGRVLASHRPRHFQRDSFFFAFGSFISMSSQHRLSMLCFVWLRASSSSLVNVLLILRLRWSLLAGSGSVSDNSTFTSLCSHCPLSSSRRCYHLISSHSKHQEATRAKLKTATRCRSRRSRASLAEHCCGRQLLFDALPDVDQRRSSSCRAA